MSPKQENPVLAEILANLKSLEPFPRVALQVLELSRREDVLPREIVEVIQADAGITSKVLRLCNSAYYGFHREIASLFEAGNMLGVRTLVDLVMTSCTGRYFRDYGDSSPDGQEELWRRSVACALASQHLAQLSHDVDEHRAYTAGLLLDIGHLVLSRFTHAHWERIQSEVLRGVDRLRAEERVLGIHHAEVGARLAERWALPDVLVDTIRWHHDPEGATVDDALTWYVHLADSVSDACLAEEEVPDEKGAALRPMGYGVARGALEATGLSGPDLKNLGELLRSDLSSANEFVEA